jgi:RHS repeat-associated protein
LVTPVQRSSSTTYDGVGNILSTTDPNGYTTTNNYDALNRRISITDPLGNTTTYDYANTGGLTCCGATGGSVLITEIIDGNGKITYYNYDALNRRTNVLNKSGSVSDTITPSDAVTTTTYDADNNRLAVTDPNNNTTKYTFDPLNRVIGLTNAAGDVSTTVYDPANNIIQTVDPRGNVTTSVYDPLNRLIEQSDSVGPVRMESYDPDENVITSTDGNGNVATNAYDALNRRISMTDPLGHTTTTVYDSDDNVVSTTDRDGNTTTWTYDPLNRQISLTDALNFTTTTAYDPDGNVISTTDPLSHTTQYFFDADDRLMQETYPDSSSDTRSYTYDGTGRLTSRLDQNGRTTTYQYNDFYDLTNRQYSVPTNPNDQYTYDLGGRLTNATRNGWTDSFTYDGANRVLTAIQNGQTVSYTYTIPSGIRTITYPGGATVTETYDLRSRLMEVNDGASPPLTRYTYDLDNHPLIRTNRNVTSAHYAYNADNWVTNLIHTNASGVIAGFAYSYDNEGNKTWQSNQTVSADSESYFYDALYRMTNFDVGVLSGGAIPSPSTAEGYVLDAAGNWLSFVSNSVTQTRTHNSVNELLTIDSTQFYYDANGNLINDGIYEYVYDVENRLVDVIRISGGALVGQYSYDALGRRIESVASPAGGATVTFLYYDGARTIEEQDGAGNPQATCTYGRYVDEILTMTRASGVMYYYHPNALFSVEAVTGASGNAVERYTYDVYGEPTVLDGAYNPVPLNSWGTPHSAIMNDYLFTERQLDEESGLYYYRARRYDCGKGRFLQRDPLESAVAANLYEYVKGRPTFATDPTGMEGAPPTPQAPANWTSRKGWFESTVRMGGCCFKVRVEIEWQQQIVMRDGVEYRQWRNLRYLNYQRNPEMPVPCTGREVGELRPNGQWSRWSPPWPPSGEERLQEQANRFGATSPAGSETAARSFAQPPSSGIGDTSPAGTETAAASFAPGLLGD